MARTLPLILHLASLTIGRLTRADEVKKPGEDARNGQIAERARSRRGTAYPSRDFH